jgi:hypothetical protein
MPVNMSLGHILCLESFETNEQFVWRVRCILKRLLPTYHLLAYIPAVVHDWYVHDSGDFFLGAFFSGQSSFEGPK